MRDLKKRNEELGRWKVPEDRHYQYSSLMVVVYLGLIFLGVLIFLWLSLSTGCRISAGTVEQFQKCDSVFLGEK